MYCSKCGFSTSGEGNFCKNCGASLYPAPEKKIELSESFKRAWFAPVAVALMVSFVYWVIPAIQEFFSNSREGLMILFAGDVDTEERIINETYSYIVSIINNALLIVVPILICFAAYVVGFIGVNKNARKRCSLSFMIPCAVSLVGFFVIYSTAQTVAHIFLLTGDIDKWDYEDICTAFLIIAAVLVVIVSYLLTWNYLRRFEKELKK